MVVLRRLRESSYNLKSLAKNLAKSLAAKLFLRRLLGVAVAWLPMAGLLATSSAHADQEVLNDLVARLQFDYYAADVRAFRRDLQALKELEVDEPRELLRTYYRAFGQMRFAETLTTRDRAEARKAAAACIDLADSIVDHDPPRMSAQARRRIDVLYAEVWAMKAACDDADAEASILPTFGAGKARERASELAPDDPRVLLLSAVHDAKHAKNEASRETAAAALRHVVEVFDNAPPAESAMPDWGQPEALAWLGKMELDLHHRAGARNALERALVLAPDYAWARGLLASLTGGGS